MEQGPCLEHIRAHVHLADAALLRRRVFLLDDPHEAAGGIADDSAEAGGVGSDRGAEQAGGLQFGEAAKQAGDALRPQHRRVSADDHHGAMGGGWILTEPLLDQ